MPTATASSDARQRCATRAAALARDPLRVAALGGDLAVEAHRGLEDDERAAGARVLAERLVLQPRAGGELAAGDVDLHALVAQDAEAAPGGLRARVVAADDDARDAGLEDRLGARRRVPVVAARLERDVQRRAVQVRVAARGDRVDLGVRAAVVVVPALAEHRAVARDDGPDERVGAHATAAPLRELDRAGEVDVVALRALHGGESRPRHPARSDRSAAGRPSSPGRAARRPAGSSRTTSRS